MKIGIIAEESQSDALLKEGLELSGNTVLVYANSQAAQTSVLEARFQNAPLPIEILIMRQGAEEDAVRRIISRFTDHEDLHIIMLHGRRSRTHNIFAPSAQEPLTIDRLIAEIEGKPANS